jgi:hypothetical protein
LATHHEGEERGLMMTTIKDTIKYQNLAREDLRRVVLSIPSDVRGLLIDGHVFLAGGFIRSVICNETPSDIDLFGSDEDCIAENAKRLSEARGSISHWSVNAHTVVTVGRIPVQFINRWLFDNPSKLLSHFDFTIARAVVWWNAAKKRWSSLCDARFYQDLAAKRLTYCAPMRDDGNGASLLRVRKFLRKGYFIGARDFGLAIAGLCSEINIKQACENGKLAERIIGKLIEVDPLQVIDGIEMSNDRELVPTE